MTVRGSCWTKIQNLRDLIRINSPLKSLHARIANFTLTIRSESVPLDDRLASLL